MPNVEVIEFALEEIQIEFYGPTPETIVTLSAPIPQSELAAITWGNVTGKPSTFAPAAHAHPQADITDLEPSVDLVVLFENRLA